MTLSSSLKFAVYSAELVYCPNSDGGGFRLFGGQINHFRDSGFRATGRVYARFNRTYGSVCSQGWDDHDAMAFCRSQFGSGTVGRAINGTRFGISPIGIRHETISSCAYSELGQAVGTRAQCIGVSNVAGVICSRECDDGNTRLVDGEAYYEGHVEACVNNQWRTICDISWDDVDATVACRSYDFFGMSDR